jgi:hypothetical protein
MTGANTTVAEHVVTFPTVHGCGTTVGELRSHFLDGHKHVALLVDGRRLVSAVEREDLVGLPASSPAGLAGTLAGRVVPPGAPAAATFAWMRENRRRRLAVVDEDGTLVGLLCLKSSGRGFCSDRDVTSRRLASAA